MNARIIVSVSFVFAMSLISQKLWAQESANELQGFIEPYRTIDISSSETGRVNQVKIVIGQRIRQGEPVAILDDELQRSMVRIAKKQAEAIGAIEAAKADRNLHQTRISQLERLVNGGYARPEELMRAKADFSIAEARVLQAEENKHINEAELERYQLQLDRRTIRSPVDGIISEVIRDPGEFVSPTDPYVAKLIQVDPLIAAFSVTSVEGVKVGDRIPVFIGLRQEQREATIESVAPQINAESGTIRIRARIANPDQKLRAGERCWLQQQVELNEQGFSSARGFSVIQNKAR